MSFTLTKNTSSVVLRNPNYGEKYRLDDGRVNRATPAGKRFIYRDSQWPESIILSYDFSNISHTTLDELKTFLETNAGLEIQVIDHLGNIVTCIVIAPTINITNESDGQFDISGNECPRFTRSFTLEFLQLSSVPSLTYDLVTQAAVDLYTEASAQLEIEH